MKKILNKLLLLPLGFSIFSAQAGYEKSYSVTIENKSECSRSERISSIIGALSLGTALGVLIYYYPRECAELLLGIPYQRQHYCCEQYRFFNTVVTNCYPCCSSNTTVLINW